MEFKNESHHTLIISDILRPLGKRKYPLVIPAGHVVDLTEEEMSTQGFPRALKLGLKEVIKTPAPTKITTSLLARLDTTEMVLTKEEVPPTDLPIETTLLTTLPASKPAGARVRGGRQAKAATNSLHISPSVTEILKKFASEPPKEPTKE